MPDGKVCTRCGEFKVANLFGLHKEGKLGLQPQCKNCCNEVRRIAIKENGDYARKNRERANKWRIENPEKAKEACRNWYVKKADKVAKYRAINRIHIISALKEWHKKNRAKSTAYSSKRNAQKINAKPSWANEFFIEQAYELANIRTKITGVEWQVDHIVPLTSKYVCGLHCESNLQVITRSENASKGNRYWPNMPDTLKDKLWVL
jgi:hypothetical protein